MKTIRETMHVKDSTTVAINSIAQQKIAAGVKVYNLSTGEPNLPPHPLIVKAVMSALEQGKTLYPPVAGIPNLRQLATEWMNRSYSCQYQTENCVVVNGGKLGIYLLLQDLLQMGDEVLIASPYWVSYPSMVSMFGGKPILIETSEDSGWKLTADNIRSACTTKTKILILNNGCNPTGTLYTQSELEFLLSAAKERDLLVISDEIYSELTYDNNHFISCGAFKEYQERVVVIQSCSKNFAMTGWRIGFVFAPANLIKQLVAFISQSTSGVTTISQWAATAALEHIDTICPWVRETMQNRRDILVGALQKNFGIRSDTPPASLYVFSKLNHVGIPHLNSGIFCAQALDKANVALVPGIAFGKEGFVRFSFGAPEQDIELGIKVLADFCR